METTKLFPQQQQAHMLMATPDYLITCSRILTQNQGHPITKDQIPTIKTQNQILTYLMLVLYQNYQTKLGQSFHLRTHQLNPPQKEENECPQTSGVKD